MANYDIYLNNMELPIGTWTQVEISQRKEGNKYKYRVKMGSRVLWELDNTKARVFNDVKVYVSDDFYPPVPGIIRNVIISKVPFVSH